ncbi:MAG: hypothetical protein LWY06_07070 [Firmicutes bacterium]|nr:hypothetical protein [Bacillota bacterium]
MRKFLFGFSLILMGFWVSIIPASADYGTYGSIDCPVPNPDSAAGSVFVNIGDSAKTCFESAYDVPGSDPDEPRVSITNPVVREFDEKFKKGEYKKVLSGKVTELNMNTGYFVASWVQAHGMPAGTNKELVYWDPGKPTKLPIVFGNQTKYMIEKVIKPGDSSPVPVNLKYPYKTWVSCSRGEILREGANVEVYYKQEGSINRAYLILGHKGK